MSENELIQIDEIKSRIFTIRGMQVMLDRDLAELYNVETKVLNQAVKRNSNRFPGRFLFVLSDQEKNELVTNCDRLRRLKHSSSSPYVFTEQGVAMLSAVLKSDTAVDVSIKIMDTFVSMRHFISENLKISQRFETVEKKQIEYQLESDKKFEIIFKALENNQLPPKQGIFFDGQVFDAHKFVSDVVRSAEKSIVLIDNYIDDTVLTLFSKRKDGVTLKILTKNGSDLQKWIWELQQYLQN